MIVKNIIKYRKKAELRVQKNKYVPMIHRKKKFKSMDDEVAFCSVRKKCGVNLSGKTYIKFENTKRETCGI